MELQTFKIKRKNTPNFFSHRFSHNLPQENNPKKYAHVDKNTIQYTYMNTERESVCVCDLFTCRSGGVDQEARKNGNSSGGPDRRMDIDGNPAEKSCRYGQWRREKG